MVVQQLKLVHRVNIKTKYSQNYIFPVLIKVSSFTENLY